MYTRTPAYAPDSTQSCVSSDDKSATHLHALPAAGDFDLHSKIGQDLGGYRLLDLVGSGAYGGVYVAEHKTSKKLTALKLLFKAGLSASEVQTQRREVGYLRTASGHPNVVQLIDSFESTKYLGIVMNYVGPHNLRQVMIRSGGLDDARVKTVFGQILGALKHCHSVGVYHRDLKLENIIVSQWNNDTVFLGDFGLATTDLLVLDTGLGSPHYIAPEGYVSGKAYSAAKADVWSLGILLFNLRFAQYPWQVPSLLDQSYRQFVHEPHAFQSRFDLSTEFMQLLTQVLDPDPGSRCSLDRLEHLLEQVGPFAKVPKTEPLQKVPASCPSSWADEFDELPFPDPAPGFCGAAWCEKTPSHDEMMAMVRVVSQTCAAQAWQ